MSARLLRRSLATGIVIAGIAIAARATGGSAWSVRRFGVVEGLVHERVNCVLQDRLGFVWFGTWEGLARFDGFEFQSFGAKDGLGSPLINALAEDRRGRLWVATHGAGVALRIDDPVERARTQRSFATYRVDATREAGIVDTLLVDDEDRLWCATQGGLYRGEFDARGAPNFARISDAPSGGWCVGTFVDRDQHVWFGSAAELLDCSVAGVRRHASPASDALVAIARDNASKVYAATRTCVFRGELALDGELHWSSVALAPAASAPIRSLSFSRDGTCWIATSNGLLSLAESGTTRRQLDNDDVHAVAVDREGDVWAATWSSGACELSRSAIRSWTTADGLPDRTALRLVDDDGERIVVSTAHGLATIENDVARAIPGTIDSEFGALGMGLRRGRDGQWWLASANGLAHCPGPRLDLARLERVTCAQPSSCVVFGGLAEDRDGSIMFGTTDGGMQRVDPRSHAAQPISLSSFESKSAVRESWRDSAGSLWLAPYTGLFRARADIVDDIASACGLENAQPRCFHEDESGRVWIGTRDAGLWFTNDPRADRPTFERVTTHDGLASDAVWSIAEDSRHNLWLGTARGVTRYDPSTKRVANFTQLDGLVGDVVQHVIVDAHGTIWAATSGGVSAIDPLAADVVDPAPPVYLKRIRIDGVELPIDGEFVSLAPPLELDANQNEIEIDFESPMFHGEHTLRWQHRITSDDDWSAPIAQRSVSFARLAPGDYAFAVRACLAGGAVSATPATFAFTILPPLWQRAWFMGITAFALAWALWTWHRSRLRRALALERVRTQIASDIHDELGSGLSQIAILSEVARRGAHDRANDPWNEIATLARSMRESVGEIVWAIDPRNDPASHLVRRMRQVAFNLLESDGTSVEFAAPEDDVLARVGLAPDRRRHLLLLVKEALSNVARHADATHVTIRLAIERERLALTIQDDGRGFDTNAERSGKGLASMQSRARALGADLKIRSERGLGTRIEFVMPIACPHGRAGVTAEPRELA